MAIRIAVASTDGKVVDEHFGRSETFYIVDAEEDGTYEVIEQRALGRVCMDGSHNILAMKQRAEALKDCEYVLVSRIGPAAENALAEYGIAAYQIPGLLQETIGKMLDYIEINQMLQGKIQI